MNPGWEQELVRYQLTSLLTPPTVAQTDISGDRTTVLRRTPVPNFDPELYVEQREWARAADGTAIPLSKIGRASCRERGEGARVAGAVERAGMRAARAER